MKNMEYQNKKLMNFILKDTIDGFIFTTSKEIMDIIGMVGSKDLGKAVTKFCDMLFSLYKESRVYMGKHIKPTISLFIEDRGILIFINLTLLDSIYYLLEDTEIDKEMYTDHPYTLVFFNENYRRCVEPTRGSYIIATDSAIRETIVDRFRKYHKAPLLDPFNLSSFREVISVLPSIKYFTKLKDAFYFLKKHDVSVVRYKDSYFYTSLLQGDLSQVEHIIQVIPKVYDTEDGIEFSYICLDHGCIDNPNYQGHFIVRDNLVTLVDSMSLHSNFSVVGKDNISFSHVNNLFGYSYDEIISRLNRPFKDIVFAATQHAFFAKNAFNDLYGITFQVTNNYTDLTTVITLSKKHENISQMNTTDVSGHVDLNTLYSILRYYLEFYNYTKYNGFRLLRSYHNSNIFVLNEYQYLSISKLIMNNLLGKILVSNDYKTAYCVIYRSKMRGYMIYRYSYVEDSNSVVEEAFQCKDEKENILDLVSQYYSSKLCMYEYLGNVFISRSIFYMTKLFFDKQVYIEEFHKE